MSSKNERLSVLSDAEQFALYGLPDFDDRQQMEFLSLSESELALVSCRPSLHAQIYCALQIGYFKAKHAFFRFDWCDVEDDSAFVLSRYFNGEQFEPESITNEAAWRLQIEVWQNSVILNPVSRRLSRAPFP